jgi:uncharacterized membrane protein
MQNFHPLFVHFPIALLLVSVVAALVAVRTRRPGAELVARVLLYTGTLAAGLTVITGFLAAQTVAPVRAAGPVIEEHQTYAYVLLSVASMLSAWSILAWRRHSRAPRPVVLWVIGQLGLAALVVLTAKEGGELVHGLGVGTALTAPGGPLHESKSAPGDSVAADSTAPRPTGKDFR